MPILLTCVTLEHLMRWDGMLLTMPSHANVKFGTLFYCGRKQLSVYHCATIPALHCWGKSTEYDVKQAQNWGRGSEIFNFARHFQWWFQVLSHPKTACNLFSSIHVSCAALWPTCCSGCWHWVRSHQITENVSEWLHRIDVSSPYFRKKALNAKRTLQCELGLGVCFQQW